MMKLCNYCSTLVSVKQSIQHNLVIFSHYLVIFSKNSIAQTAQVAPDSAACRAAAQVQLGHQMGRAKSATFLIARLPVKEFVHALI